LQVEESKKSKRIAAYVWFKIFRNVKRYKLVHVRNRCRNV
jgi:hypothetical protein